MPVSVQRLRDRKVVQWALAYLAAAWLFLQAFGFVADRFGWPSTLVRGATILLGVGFLVALVLAWYHGEKGRQRLSGPELASLAALFALAGVLLRVYAREEVRVSDPAVPALVRSAPTRFFVPLPEGETLRASEPALAISRDGSQLVYAAGHGDTTRLYLRRLDRFGARPIAGTEGARAPFFSPDGEWVGFFADGAVKKISVRGGAPQTLVEAAWTARSEALLSGSWDEADRLLLSYPGADVGSSIWEVSAQGGAVRRLTEPHWHENHFRPERLPAREDILLSVWDSYGGDTRIVVLTPETGEERVVVEPGSNGRYVSSGHLVYRLGDDLMAVRFDPDHLEVDGPAVPVILGVLVGDLEALQYAVSESGTLAYVPAGVDRIARRLVWADTLGHIEPVAESPTNAYTPRLGPEGRRVIFQRRPEQELWLLDLGRGTPRRLTEAGTSVFWHVWTPRGDGIVFNADLGESEWLNLYLARLGGADPPERLLDLPSHQQPQDWTPDGRELVYTQVGDPGTGVDIWALRVSAPDATRAVLAPRPVLRTRADEFHPAVSPDGRWLAYASDVSGRWEVYLASYPEPGPSLQVSTEGGSEPRWAPDGQTLYYRSRSERNIARQMIAVPLRARGWSRTGLPEIGASRVLFDGPFYQCSEWGRSYDVSPDGGRFLMVHDQRPEFTATEIDVVVDWFVELPRL